MSEIALETDVLVIGGGMAAAWAAISAARSGAQVVLADKGFVGNRHGRAQPLVGSA